MSRLSAGVEYGLVAQLTKKNKNNKKKAPPVMLPNSWADRQIKCGCKYSHVSELRQIYSKSEQHNSFSVAQKAGIFPTATYA